MGFSLVKYLRKIYSYPSLVLLCLPIISASVSSIMHLVVQITSIDVVLMVCCMVGQLSTMVSSVIYNGNFNMGYMILSRVLMIP